LPPPRRLGNRAEPAGRQRDALLPAGILLGLLFPIGGIVIGFVLLGRARNAHGVVFLCSLVGVVAAAVLIYG